MLDPDVRALLLDSLRPPPGMRVDRAIATTFTLDLGSALLVPLALAGFGLSGDPDPIAVMESLRSTVDRLDVFAQAGMISAAGWPGDLAALLEPAIHTVRRPRPGLLFHPKSWVVRFSDPDGHLAYRCIVTSRNLTADRSWDVVLRLDSDPSTTRINPGNDGLRRLLDALPTMTDTPLDDGRQREITELADELRRVWWQCPDGVDHVTFWTMGVRGGPRRSTLTARFRGYRHLIVSPYVNADGIAAALDGSSTVATVVARGEELDRMPAADLADVELLTLDPLAGLDDDADVSPGIAPSPFGDLHAKIYVVESNRRARVFVGSANATGAGFGGNVELLCELDGRVRELGVETMVGADASFRSLLRSHLLPRDVVVDAEADAAWRLQSYLVDLAEMGFTVTVTDEADGWCGTISSDEPIPGLPAATAISVTLSPFNRAGEIAVMVPGELVTIPFTARPAADLTAFLVVTAAATIDGRRVERSCVVRARLVGAPAVRLDDILVRQLDTPEKFLRFLMLLLAIGAGRTEGLDAGEAGTGMWRRGSDVGVMEMLVRAVAVQPKSVDRLTSTIERLMASPQASTVVPQGWERVWEAVRTARTQLGDRADAP